MWIAVLIAVLVCYAIYRFCWALVKPIVVFVHQTVLDLLMGLGMSELAAKAAISLIIIIAILALIFG